MELTSGILIRSFGLFMAQVIYAFDVPAGEMTSGRARALVGGVIALISVIVGTIAFFRSRGGCGKICGIVALVLGLIGFVLGVLHLAASTGGFGTGGGRLGAIVGLVLGLIGMNLGGIALMRARRAE